MSRHLWLLAVVPLLLIGEMARATIFGDARGIVHDPQHRPVAGATVTLQAKSADFSRSATTDEKGEFLFRGVPLGEYSVTQRERNVCSTTGVG